MNLISALGTNGLLSISNLFLIFFEFSRIHAAGAYSVCYNPVGRHLDRGSVSDVICLIVRELPKGLHVLGCSRFNAEVSAFEPVYRYHFGAFNVFIFALFHGSVYVGFQVTGVHGP
jgi:hypothetical protein